MQKKVAFYHNKDIDKLKLRCTVPNLANICLHKSTDATLYLFTDGDKDLLKKLREDVVRGAPIVFRRRAVVDEIFVRKTTNICKSFVGIDASQPYPTQCVNPFPPVYISVGIWIQKPVDAHVDKNKTHSSENMATSCFQRTRPDV